MIRGEGGGGEGREGSKNAYTQFDVTYGRPHPPTLSLKFIAQSSIRTWTWKVYLSLSHADWVTGGPVLFHVFIGHI